jgi:hypothetical protein
MPTMRWVYDPKTDTMLTGDENEVYHRELFDVLHEGEDQPWIGGYIYDTPGNEGKRNVRIEQTYGSFIHELDADTCKRLIQKYIDGKTSYREAASEWKVVDVSDSDEKPDGNAFYTGDWSIVAVSSEHTVYIGHQLHHGAIQRAADIFDDTGINYGRYSETGLGYDPKGFRWFGWEGEDGDEIERAVLNYVQTSKTAAEKWNVVDVMPTVYDEKFFPPGTFSLIADPNTKNIYIAEQAHHPYIIEGAGLDEDESLNGDGNSRLIYGRRWPDSYVSWFNNPEDDRGANDAMTKAVEEHLKATRTSKIVKEAVTYRWVYDPETDRLLVARNNYFHNELFNELLDDAYDMYDGNDAYGGYVYRPDQAELDKMAEAVNAFLNDVPEKQSAVIDYEKYYRWAYDREEDRLVVGPGITYNHRELFDALGLDAEPEDSAAGYLYNWVPGMQGVKLINSVPDAYTGPILAYYGDGDPKEILKKINEGDYMQMGMVNSKTAYEFNPPLERRWRWVYDPLEDRLIVQPLKDYFHNDLFDELGVPHGKGRPEDISTIGHPENLYLPT